MEAGPDIQTNLPKQGDRKYAGKPAERSSRTADRSSVAHGRVQQKGETEGQMYLLKGTPDGQTYLLKGEAVAHDSPGMGGTAVLCNGFLGQIAHLHLLLHVPQHSAVHLQSLSVTCIQRHEHIFVIRKCILY